MGYITEKSYFPSITIRELLKLLREAEGYEYSPYLENFIKEKLNFYGEPNSYLNYDDLLGKRPAPLTDESSFEGTYLIYREDWHDDEYMIISFETEDELINHITELYDNNFVDVMIPIIEGRTRTYNYDDLHKQFTWTSV